MLLLAVLLLLLYAVMFSVIAKANGHTLPMPFGFGVSSVLTGSMEPNIPQGSMVVVTPAESYKVGDVVAYQTEKGKICTVHRIVEMNGDTIITCGDANGTSKDPPITADKIKGKVAFHIPVIGNVILVLQSPVVMILLLMAAGVLFFMSWKSADKKKQEREAKDIQDMKDEIRRLKAESQENDQDHTP